MVFLDPDEIYWIQARDDVARIHNHTADSDRYIDFTRAVLVWTAMESGAREYREIGSADRTSVADRSIDDVTGCAAMPCDAVALRAAARFAKPCNGITQAASVQRWTLLEPRLTARSNVGIDGGVRRIDAVSRDETVARYGRSSPQPRAPSRVY